MIRLTKSEKPQILQENEELWKTEILTLIQQNQTIPNSLATKYRHEEIKTAVLSETNQKCAYCESKILHVHHSEIEHIKPKSKFPEQTFEWTNLTISCSLCNNKKSDFYDESRPLINPFVDNPDDHLDSEGPLLFALDSSTKGKISILKLDLNRSALLLNRSEKLKPLLSLVARINSETDSTKKEILKDELIAESSSDKEYSFIVKKLLLNRQII